MIPVKTETTNAVFVAECCEDLPATTCHDDNGINYVETCWELSDEELAEVIKTKRIYVNTIGTEVNPIRVEARSLIVDGED